MTKQRKPRLPRMGRHSTGQARVTLNGRVHYLGPYDSLEAQRNYLDLMQRWEANGRQPLDPARTVVQGMTLSDLFAAWMAQLDASGRYHKNGQPTSARGRLQGNTDEFLDRFGDVAVGDYTERLLLFHRDDLETRPKLTRVGINRKIGTLRDGLRWGYERGFIGRDAWLATSELRPLSRAIAGHRDQKRPKRAPSEQEIEAVARAAGEPVTTMLLVHFAIGCRPGELVSMRWGDIDRTPIKGCWTYRVRDAKSSHHGHETSYAIPPQTQSLLLPLSRSDMGLVFLLSSPGMSGVGSNRPWTTIAYRERIQRACKRAGVAPFTGHEVRHAAITAACARYGTFAAAAFANHARVSTTEAYLHRADNDRYRVAAGLAEARQSSAQADD